jgi:hypothetical protein
VQLSKYRTLAQIAEVAADCMAPNWGGEDELPISGQAVSEARQLVDILPPSYANAEVSPEPLGSLALEWRFGPMRTMIVSVSGRGVIEYAGLAGQSTEFHGRAVFTGELPQIMLTHLNSVRGS